MKIAFLSRYQNSMQRGAEVFVKELSEALKKKYPVDILSGKDADSLTKILAGKYDVVFPINGGLQSFKASLGRIIGGYKIVISGQAGEGVGSIFNIAVAIPDVYVALTDQMVGWVKKWAWHSKVVKIPNGVDLKKFTPVGDKLDINLPRPIILSVGALTWYKHHEKVIRAMGELGNGSLLIVGEGEDKKRLEEEGKRILGDRFKILNFSYQEMPKVYRSADLFTLSSWGREAFGISYLEAMASGLGVVAPDDLSRREIVGEAGLFVDVSNPKLFAQAIKEALDIDWKSKAGKQAKKFSWDEIVKKYENIMKELL